MAAFVENCDRLDYAQTAILSRYLKQ